MSHWFFCAPLIVVLGCAMVPGCGRSVGGSDAVEVTGTVTYQSNPVEGANVIFQPAAGSSQTMGSQAVTDAKGRFTLSTHVGGGKFKPGIAPGQYVVSITKLDTAGISNTLAAPKDLLPKTYGNPKTSGLTAEVALGRENNFEFVLRDN